MTRSMPRWCVPAMAGCMLSIMLIMLAVGCSSNPPAPSPGYYDESTESNASEEQNNAKRNRSNVARNAGSAEMDANADIQNAGD